LIVPGKVTENDKKHIQLHRIREITINGIRQEAIEIALNCWQQRAEAYEKGWANIHIMSETLFLKRISR